MSGQGQIQDLVLRALDQRDAFNGYEDMLNGLTRHFGLYPYLNPAALGIKDALVLNSILKIRRWESFFSKGPK